MVGRPTTVVGVINSRLELIIITLFDSSSSTFSAQRSPRTEMDVVSSQCIDVMPAQHRNGPKWGCMGRCRASPILSDIRAVESRLVWTDNTLRLQGSKQRVPGTAMDLLAGLKVRTAARVIPLSSGRIPH